MIRYVPDNSVLACVARGFGSEIAFGQIGQPRWIKASAPIAPLVLTLSL